MTETQRRIRAYKRALPELRERVVAVALLLAMSASMLASASFAWLTISRRPEVTGVNTTVAANGNLEIALATGNGMTAPGESQVGDSSAREGQSVMASNITWGNLINLSDVSYGLENLTLRPAQLNTAALLSSPLYGAVFQTDGRIDQLSSNFAYTKWIPPEGEKEGYFGVSEEFGVRAISSTKIEAVGADAIYANMVLNAKNTNLVAANAYVALGSNGSYMPSLATMMGLYMTARMNPDHAELSNPDCAIADIQNLRDMYGAFLEAFDLEANAMANLLNLQLFLAYGENNYTPYTAEMVLATTEAKLKAEGLQITKLDEFIKDRNTIASDYQKLITICQSGTSLKWKDSGLNAIVNNLVNVGACTIGANNTPISSIGASNAMSYLSGTQEARITNGILYRFEERTGGYIEVKNLGISATVNRMGMTIPATVKANIQTTAPRDYNLFTNDLTYSESLNTGEFKGGIAIAEDTYGLAVDMWVRTNAADSYLVLEGNVVTETKQERATTKDANGNTVEVYVWNQTGQTEEGETISVDTDVYQIVDEKTNTTTWYNAGSHMVITEEELDGAVPTPKMIEVEYVQGYEGENRIWTKNEQLSTDATTQGSGSCYVYYADTPEDQARSLKLLEAFNVAFVNQTGKLLCTANMDTSRYYAQDGRVIVPLVLDTSNSINLGENYQGKVTYAITELEKNVATRITAIVYLDGTKLTNQDVLAASDIQGQLNIQFGSSADLNALTNEELETQECRVTAAIDKNSFDYMSSTEPMTTNVTLTVDGAEPNTVKAFFLRSISATQGSREETMTFTKGEGAQWTSSYTFTSPGKYILRSVQLDGVEYDLSNNELPTVNISGFAVKSLTYTGGSTEGNSNAISVKDAGNSYTVGMSLQFALGTDDESKVDQNKLPKSVRGLFIRAEDGSAVTVDFHMGSGLIWTGSATFISSGNYTMQYLILDGEYMELDPGLWKTANVTLGMKVAVYTTSPHSFKYVPSEMTDNQKLLGMQVMVMDNSGKEMPGMSGLKLTYGMKGSGLKKMDTDLTWDGEYYTGELTTTGPGIWQFSNVTVSGNVLTVASTAPTFTILSPEPPEYYGHSTAAYQYRPDNKAVMNVQISNSSAAAVQGYIVKAGAAEGVWVDGTIGQELTTGDGKPANHWSFKIPTDANGYQDGNWNLTALKLWDVFAADGTAYTEESPLEIDISDENNTTKVVSRAYITFAEDKSQNFGTDASGKVTGVFMDTYTVSGLSVKIQDFEGKPLQNISNVQLKFTYKEGTSVSRGGYSVTLADVGGEKVVALDADAAGTQFTQNGSLTMQFAGDYETEFSFKIGDTTYVYKGKTDESTTKALPANAPVFTVSSVKPTVTITEITDFKNKSGSAVSTTDGTTATVYADEYETKSTVCGQTFTYKAYHQPYVKIELTGFGNASTAYLEFTETNNGTVHLYPTEEGAANTATDTYKWTGNGTCQRWVGYWNSQTGDDDRTAAGTLTADTLVLTLSNGKSYDFKIPNIIPGKQNITINNPT